MDTTAIKSFSIISNSRGRQASGIVNGKEVFAKCAPTASDDDCRAALLKAAGNTTKTPGTPVSAPASS